MEYENKSLIISSRAIDKNQFPYLLVTIIKQLEKIVYKFYNLQYLQNCLNIWKISDARSMTRLG
ncbi:hypothetical protein T09_1 [Trichinella sp. T9]|nr:hypothetical protein T09_1 [Trichinella sp. T9]